MLLITDTHLMVAHKVTLLVQSQFFANNFGHFTHVR